MMQKTTLPTQLKTQPSDWSDWLAQPVSSRWDAMKQLRQQAFPISNPDYHAKH
jgi:hypothetical protein